jgi:diguanylate cyclase (GGDEF)-like protein/PAS domain S-box-containing protein
MLVFEAAKQALRPRISIWASHAITILFITLMAAVLNFIAFRKEERFRFEFASNEKRYRTLFERSLTGVYRTTLDGRILDCNAAFCQIFGYLLPEEVLGHSVTGLRTNRAGYLSSADRARFKEKLQSENGVTNFEQCLRRKDGSAVWVLNNAILLPSEDGSESVIEGTMIDISQRKRAEEAIRESETRYRLLFERNLAGVVRTSLEGRIVECNPAGARMFGYGSPEEIISTSIIDAYQTISDREAFLKKLKAEKKLTNHEMSFRRKSGDSFWAMLNASTVDDDSGVPGFIEATLVDITDSKRSEEVLRQAARRLSAQHSILDTERNMLRALIDNIPDFIYVKDAESRFVVANRHVARVMGVETQEALLGKTDFDFYPQEIAKAFYEDEQNVMRSGQPLYNREEKAVDNAGNEIHILTTKVPFRDNTGQVTGVAGVGRDITDRKRAEEALRTAEEKYRAIFEDAVIGIFQATPDGRPLSINRALAEIHGYDSATQLMAEVANVVSELFVHPDQMEEIGKVLAEKGVVRNLELELYRKDRSKRSVLANIRGVRDAGGRLTLIEGTMEDITDRKQAEERVQFLAYYDALTGLPNRTLLQDRLGKALASARRRKEKVAVMFLDLDRFKIINDSLGHSIGDQLLQNVAERLRNWSREQDTVARIGGDEFVIVLCGVKDVPDVAVAAERVMDTMVADLLIQDRRFNVSCSIGISIYPDHGLDSETLIKNADAAMYSAKESGRNNFRFFTNEMNVQVVERLTIEHNLRLALERDEFFLVYQPQMDIRSGQIAGMEALIRWRHPELGLVLPGRFMSVAENSGLILPIGEWVLRTACRAARHWQEQGLPPLPVAVNVSAIQFRQEAFGALVRNVLQTIGLATHFLELEVTESLLLSNAERSLPVLHELKAMGVKLTIDDFGTGYSSLSYLRHFPINKLKIDRSFIKMVASNPGDAAITAAIIVMAKSLNLKVIAEGVEDSAQMSFLEAHQCDEIQGYYFSKPLTCDEITAKLRQGGGYPTKGDRPQSLHPANGQHAG